MYSLSRIRIGLFSCTIWAVCSVLSATAGVSQSIQDQYIRNYKDKMMYLKIPMYSDRRIVNIEGGGFWLVPGTGSPRHKVGDQLRITRIDFGGNEIRFQLGVIASQEKAEIIFKFNQELQENFPGRGTFDKALQAIFTEGLKYTDIEDAKVGFINGEFEHSVDKMAEAASLSREFVLEKIAPLIPDHVEVLKDRDALNEKVQDISAQNAQLRADNLKLETKMSERENELSRVGDTNASLQKKVKSAEMQVIKLEAELLNSEDKVRKYEREIADIQRSLNLEADSNRDLAKNIEELTDRIITLQADLEEQMSTNTLLADEIEDYKTEIRKIKSTIRTLTSDKNSIGRQYVEIKDEKEKLDEFVIAVNALHARSVEEKTEGGYSSGKVGIYARDVLIGHLEWSVPSYLDHNGAENGTATFTAESIDYVKVAPEDRQLLRTLGERLKIRLDLVSLSSSMEISADEEAEPHEIGERKSYTWNWRIINNGALDVPFLLSAHLVNKNSQEIELFRKEQVVATSNPVRRIRTYLEPVPIAIGVVLGFLLFGIVGIFRRPKSRKEKTPSGSGSNSKPFVGEKKL